MAYHPDKNPTELPPVRTVEDLGLLPWGGNAWWDLPIMNHVNKTVLDETLPREVRKAISELSGYLMTGEDCTYETDADFDFDLEEMRRQNR